MTDTKYTIAHVIDSSTRIIVVVDDGATANRIAKDWLCTSPKQGTITIYRHADDTITWQCSACRGSWQPIQDFRGTPFEEQLEVDNGVQVIQGCSVEWDQRRGVLYVHHSVSGRTIVRVSRLPARDRVDLTASLIDIDGSRSSITMA